jgi:hypothetical protein
MAALLALIALPALLTACGSSDPEPTATTSVGPISFPYVFEGNFTVAGQPGPAGTPIFTMLNGAQSGSVNEAVREGEYTNVIAGANKPEDVGKTITFHIGDPEGENVQAEQTVEFHATGELQRVRLDLTFPELP